jgi:N-succinyldiaminopimelate aminotransferase
MSRPASRRSAWRWAIRRRGARFHHRGDGRHAASFGNYPAITGTEDWRQAAADWLNRAFPERRDRCRKTSAAAERHPRRAVLGAVSPHAGAEQGRRQRPIVAMPNPFYQCYAAAALAAGAEPLYVPATEANTASCPISPACRKTMLERIAAVYICSPSNPEGAVAGESYWRKLFALAERFDFIVLADECYADIYFGIRRPPRC